MEFGLGAMPDPSRVKKNSFYEDIVKNGFSIAIHYNPDDVANIISDKQKFALDLMEHDPEEIAAFEEYRKF